MDNKLAGTNAKCTHRVAENAGVVYRTLQYTKFVKIIYKPNIDNLSVR